MFLMWWHVPLVSSTCFKRCFTCRAILGVSTRGLPWSKWMGVPIYYNHNWGCTTKFIWIHVFFFFVWKEFNTDSFDMFRPCEVYSTHPGWLSHFLQGDSNPNSLGIFWDPWANSTRHWNMFMKVCAYSLASILSGWWFGTFIIFPYIGNNHPNWLIFLESDETTNQIIYVYNIQFPHVSSRSWRD